MNALVISDRRELRSELESRLRSGGFEVACRDYTNAASACERAQWPALFVLDALSGNPWGLCRRIRAQADGNLALIWVVAKPDDAQARRSALEAGADECFAFPETSDFDLRVAAAARRILAMAEIPRAKQELRENIERWSLAERGAVAGVWDARPSRQPLGSPDEIVWYSAGMKQIFGYSDEEFPNVLGSWMSRVHPDDLQGVVQAIRQSLADKSQFDCEYRLLTKAAGYRWFDSRGQGVYDAEGRLQRVNGSVRDVTENRRVADALQASEEKWRSLVENAPDTITVVDPEGKILFMNRDWPRMTTQRSLGADLVSLAPESWRDSMRAVLQQVARSGQAGRFELTVSGDDGKPIWYACRVGPIHSTAGTVALVVITTDISSRKRAEEEREQFVATIENSSDLIGMVSESGKILHLNPAGCKLIGLPDQEAAKKLSLVDLYADDCRVRYTEEIRPKLYADARWAGEVRFRNVRTGNAIDVHQKLFLIRRPRSDMPLCLATVTRDIRARKRHEAALHEEQELMRKLLDLHERDRQLVAYEIHDGLAQQMTAALMHFQAFQHHAAEPAGNSDFERGLSLLREAGQEARRLISGLRPPVLDELGIIAAIEYLINEIRTDVPEITFIHHTKFVRLAPPLESAIFRIVQEALSNIRAHSGSRRAKIELLEHGQQLRLVVRDWGEGFDLANVTKGRFGLQGIRQRGRLLGATVVIESQPGNGTTVVVDFPLIVDRRGNGSKPGVVARP